MSKDIISVILTTCCVTDYRLSLLKLSTHSFLNNTFMKDKQWIICDNGDKRQTDYIKTLDCDKHIEFGENKGIAYARNAGAEAATGDYICFVDGDIIYYPLWLRTLKSLLYITKGRYIASGMINRSYGGVHKYIIDHSMHWQIWTKANSGCLLMERQTWEKVGPWKNFWKLGTAFNNSARKRGYRFIIPTPEVVAHMDSKPSYDKKSMNRAAHKKEKPIWKMKT